MKNILFEEHERIVNSYSGHNSAMVKMAYELTQKHIIQFAKFMLDVDDFEMTAKEFADKYFESLDVKQELD